MNQSMQFWIQKEPSRECRNLQRNIRIGQEYLLLDRREKIWLQLLRAIY